MSFHDVFKVADDSRKLTHEEQTPPRGKLWKESLNKNSPSVPRSTIPVANRTVLHFFRPTQGKICPTFRSACEDHGTQMRLSSPRFPWQLYGSNGMTHWM